MSDTDVSDPGHSATSPTGDQPHTGSKGCKCCKRFCRLFSLDGHLSYAFIYGSWEIVRARKVGTTHTRLDYVVYRLFFPVILVGVAVFALVSEYKFKVFFLQIEVWNTILHISYAVIFLQNVLQNNLHRENVKHRQKIPERLVVTDEIEKGGHRFYICKRYSILPTEKLYHTERLIWFLFNVLAATNIAILVGYLSGVVELADGAKDGNEDNEMLRNTVLAVLVVADVVLTPIPVRLAHAVFPLLYFTLYNVFQYILTYKTDIVLYKDFNPRQYGDAKILKSFTGKALIVLLIHILLSGLASFRDYIISLLDDSRTAKQQQSLRSQKRLARRKLMNYVEGPDGKIIGISLEKHKAAPVKDEFIRSTRKSMLLLQEGKHGGDDDEEETGRMKMFRSNSARHGQGDLTTRHVGVESEVESVTSKLDLGAKHESEPDLGPSDSVPLDVKRKPPPSSRYKQTDQEGVDQFSPSSSSLDEAEVIQSTIERLPSVPKDEPKQASEGRKNAIRASKIPVPILHKFGEFVQPRDSRENIHQHLDNPGDSPPTPPFVKLVQTLISQQKRQSEIEREARHHKHKKPLVSHVQASREGAQVHTRAGSALLKVVRVIRAADEKNYEGDFLPKQTGEPTIRRLDEGGIFHVDTPPARSQATNRKRSKKAGKKMEDEIDRLVSAAVGPPLATLRGEGTSTPKLPLEKSGSGKRNFGAPDRPVAPRVIHVKAQEPNPLTPEQHKTMLNFHKELTSKLENVQSDKGNAPEKTRRKEKKKRPSLEKKMRVKSILKHDDNVQPELPSRSKKREEKFKKRREARVRKGKHGKPVYDPLIVPSIADGKVESATTFHILGTHLTGEKEKVEKTTVPKEEAPLYRTHPGIGTVDDSLTKDEKGRPTVLQGKSIVAFHPLVRFFEINEKPAEENTKKKKKRPPFKSF